VMEAPKAAAVVWVYFFYQCVENSKVQEHGESFTCILN